MHLQMPRALAQRRFFLLECDEKQLLRTRRGRRAAFHSRRDESACLPDPASLADRAEMAGLVHSASRPPRQSALRHGKQRTGRCSWSREFAS
mmetsp:Transcript_40548/g.67175  ORF Transcript_40548/g.67175 Transcript_40548/m.67175 type:complete len:92 (+) Transcript_40548:1106-1381(+)